MNGLKRINSQIGLCGHFASNSEMINVAIEKAYNFFANEEFKYHFKSGEEATLAFKKEDECFTMRLYANGIMTESFSFPFESEDCNNAIELLFEHIEQIVDLIKYNNLKMEYVTYGYSNDEIIPCTKEHIQLKDLINTLEEVKKEAILEKEALEKS